MIVDRHLEILDGMRGGFFLDSGAADGVKSSNTLLLERSFGWNGVCVEPNQALFSALRANRRCCCLNCCLYIHEGTVTFLEGAGMLGGIIAHYSPELLLYARRHFPGSHDARGNPKVQTMPARSALSVLSEHCPTKTVDYWSLDTEGSELTILQGFPFEEYTVRVITVEHNCSSARDEIRSFLDQKGYERVRSLQIDDCYVQRRQLSSRAWRSKAFITRPRR